MGRQYGKLPSEIVDPYRERLTGGNRIMFDATMIAGVLQDARIAAGDTEGVSVKAQVEYERRNLDMSGYNELERIKANLKRR